MKTIFYGIALGFGMNLGTDIYREFYDALGRQLWKHRNSIDAICDKYGVRHFNLDNYAPENYEGDTKPKNKIGF